MSISLLRSNRRLRLTLPPNPVCELHLVGYRHSQLTFYAQFVRRVLKKMGVRVMGPMQCERSIRRWTVLRSPFKYKRAQETFERKEFENMLYLYDVSQVTLDGCLHYVTQMTPPGMNITWNRYHHEKSASVLLPLSRPIQPWSEKVFYQDIANEIHAKYQRGEL